MAMTTLARIALLMAPMLIGTAARADGDLDAVRFQPWEEGMVEVGATTLACEIRQVP
jgi:hypothetical protein